MQDPRRSSEQCLALLCYRYLNKGEKLNPLHTKAAYYWLTKRFPKGGEHYKLMEFLCYVTLKLEDDCNACKPAPLQPATLMKGFSDGWKDSSKCCDLDASCSEKELTEWAHTRLWALFLKRHLCRKSMDNTWPITAECTRMTDSLARTLTTRDLSVDMDKRARHLVTLSLLPIGSYTQFRATYPNIAACSVAASDVAIQHKVDLSQISLNPSVDWGKMSVTTRQIWLACALCKAWSITAEDNDLSAEYVLFPCELGIPGVAERFWKKKCKMTLRPKIPRIVHMGENHWLVISPFLGTYWYAEGVVAAYECWYNVTRVHFQGKTELRDPVPSLKTLSTNGYGI